MASQLAKHVEEVSASLLLPSATAGVGVVGKPLGRLSPGATRLLGVITKELSAVEEFGGFLASLAALQGEEKRAKEEAEAKRLAEAAAKAAEMLVSAHRRITFHNGSHSARITLSDGMTASWSLAPWVITARA